MAAEVQVLKLVCEKLESANVPYMLTGSFAANFFAVPRGRFQNRFLGV